jgi:hypothetical protein
MKLKINILLFLLVTTTAVLPQQRNGNFQGGQIIGKVIDYSTKHTI